MCVLKINVHDSLCTSSLSVSFWKACTHKTEIDCTALTSYNWSGLKTGRCFLYYAIWWLILAANSGCQSTSESKVIFARRQQSRLQTPYLRSQVDSKANLAAAWAADPAFMKRELRAWLRRDGAVALDALWPQLLAQAATP